MKFNQKLTGIFLIGVATLFIQCKDSGTAVVADENELITSVTLNFTETGTGIKTTFSYKDADGDGGNLPTKFDTVSLKANTTYTLTVAFLDESKNPADDITKEIDQESFDHLLVYTSLPASLLTYTYGDKDKNNYPIGLTGTVKSGIAGIGKLKLQLRHQPGSKNGTATPGSDDVNIDFNLKVN